MKACAVRTHRRHARSVRRFVLCARKHCRRRAVGLRHTNLQKVDFMTTNQYFQQEMGGHVHTQVDHYVKVLQQMYQSTISLCTCARSSQKHADEASPPKAVTEELDAYHWGLGRVQTLQVQQGRSARKDVPCTDNAERQFYSGDGRYC